MSDSYRSETIERPRRKASDRRSERRSARVSVRDWSDYTNDADTDDTEDLRD